MPSSVLPISNAVFLFRKDTLPGYGAGGSFILHENGSALAYAWYLPCTAPLCDNAQTCMILEIALVGMYLA